ncbi:MULTISPECIES: AraC family transcriptional regulator [Anoxybacillus]|uniref:AraC family transcriptional regulator n=1 Tax=Anoxybacillus flavithermus AK1 TaxID=1297581 RepID=M8D7F2_9BACL|nr:MULTISPECIES: AraC family transcriptional regulator [Anoxybacillus]EMT46726.1 AraC family transcriptional regulator [Anoxybacillus flavithermus AK1]MBW7650669.1 helix-turn-helix domain-containing protein [Anoxybacillus sp. ST4]
MYISFSVPPFPVFIKGGEAMFRKGMKHFRRTFSVFDFLYVQKGTLHMTEQKETFVVREGEYVILCPGFEHYGHEPCEEDTHFIWIHFSLPQYDRVEKEPYGWGDIIEREATYVDYAQYRLFIPQYGKLKQAGMESMLQHIVREQQTPDHSLTQQLLFAQWIVQLQKQTLHIPTAAEHVCAEAMEYIHQHYGEPFNMEHLAYALRLHPDYISRCMQKTIGMSALQYVNDYRINIAKKKLAATNETIAAIAKQVGFEDGAYFSRVFKKIEGMTPGEYRRFIQRT